MSRGCKALNTGGIGKGWFEKYRKDVYPSDEVIVNGARLKPPRFYDNLLEHEEPDLLERLKARRIAEAPGWHRVTTPGAVKFENENGPARLAVKERVKLAAIQSLKRTLEDSVSSDNVRT